MKICPQCFARLADTFESCEADGSSLLALVENDPRVGEVVAGRFLFTEMLGKGGMGAVYRAHQISMRRDVAVKVLLPSVSEDETVVQRFIREARSAAQLRSPHTVIVYDFGEMEDGGLFIAMELLRGVALSDRLRHGGAFPVARALELTGQICLSLEEAHSQGIVHRDLKPANIMLEPRSDGEEIAKVVDFGIAKVLDATATAITQDGLICGTPAYMSPEQALGKNIGPGSDIYSLGIVMFEMLVGRKPFMDESAAALLIKQIQEVPPSLLELGAYLGIPGSVDELVSVCLRKEPSERFRSAADLRAACAASMSPEGQGPGTSQLAPAFMETGEEVTFQGVAAPPGEQLGTDPTLVAAAPGAGGPGTIDYVQPVEPAPVEEDAPEIVADLLDGKSQSSVSATFGFNTITIISTLVVAACLIVVVADPLGWRQPAPDGPRGTITTAQKAAEQEAPVEMAKAEAQPDKSPVTETAGKLDESQLVAMAVPKQPAPVPAEAKPEPSAAGVAGTPVPSARVVPGPPGELDEAKKSEIEKVLGDSVVNDNALANAFDGAAGVAAAGVETDVATDGGAPTPKAPDPEAPIDPGKGSPGEPIEKKPDSPDEKSPDDSGERLAAEERKQAGKTYGGGHKADKDKKDGGDEKDVAVDARTDEKTAAEEKKTPQVSIRLGGVKVMSGSIDQGAAKAAVMSRKKQIVKCYRKQFGSHSDPPSVKLHIMVGPDGKILSVKAKPKNSKSKAFSQCVRPALAGSGLPPFDGSAFSLVSMKVGP